MTEAPTRDDNPVESLQRGWQLADDLYHALPPGFLPYLWTALALTALWCALAIGKAHRDGKARRAKAKARARAKARKTSRRKPTNRPKRPRHAV